MMETVKLAASRLAEAARRHERISSSDYIRNTADVRYVQFMCLFHVGVMVAKLCEDS